MKNNIGISVFYDHIVQANEQSNISILEIMKLAKQSGIDTFEINIDTLINDEADISSYLGQTGLKISCIYGFYEFDKNGDIDSAKRHIDYAAKYGASKILVIPGFLTENEVHELKSIHYDYELIAAFLDNNKAVSNMVTMLKQMTKYAENKGVIVTLEDFDAINSPFARAYELLWFINNVEGLKVTFDCGNFVFSNENVLTAYEILKDHIVHVHCKDRGEEEHIIQIAGNKAELVNRGLASVSAGRGYLPIKEIVEKLLNQGYCGYLAIEHFDYPVQIQGIKESSKYLHEIIDNE